MKTSLDDLAINLGTPFAVTRYRDSRGATFIITVSSGPLYLARGVDGRNAGAVVGLPETAALEGVI
jgi:ADP-heptose:LPS heptosyltransferase